MKGRGTSALLDGALAHLELRAEGWSLSEARAQDLARWLKGQLEADPSLELLDLFKLLAQLESTQAPAAAPLLATLRCVPAVVKAARALRGRLESKERALVQAFLAFEGQASTKTAARIDAARPPGTVPAHALMRSRPLRRPRPEVPDRRPIMPKGSS